MQMNQRTGSQPVPRSPDRNPRLELGEFIQIIRMGGGTLELSGASRPPARQASRRERRCEDRSDDRKPRYSPLPFPVFETLDFKPRFSQNPSAGCGRISQL